MVRRTPPPAPLIRRGVALGRARARDLLVHGAVFQLLAGAALTPVLAVVARLLFALTGRQTVANADLLTFALSPVGALSTLLLAILAAALWFAGHVGPFAIAVAAAHGRRLSWFAALRVLAARPLPVLRVAAAVVLRALGIALPFVAIIALTHRIWLGAHDINYYLTDRPPEFWTAVAVAAVLTASMAAVLAVRLVGWLLALPLAVLGGEPPRAALRHGHAIAAEVGRIRALGAIVAGPAAVAAIALAGAAVLAALSALGLDSVGDRLRPAAALLGLTAAATAALAFAAHALGAAIAVCTATAVLESAGALPEVGGATVVPSPPRARRRAIAATVAAVVAAVAIGGGLLTGIRSPDRVVCVAHRAGAAHGPENSRAALRAAIDAGAEFAEIDVQRAAGGTVVVIHDRDLMKLAGRPWRVAETHPDQLAGADVGNGEGIATLAEFCALAGDRIRLCVELKYYGWDEELAPATLAVLRAAGVLDRAEIMSLEARAVAQVRRLDPAVRLGYLASVAAGDLSRLDVDFLALAAGAATTARIAAAGARGLDVYAWTLNDADGISDAIDRGVAGVITDDPPLFGRVLAERAALTDLERLLLRFGALHGR